MIALSLWYSIVLALLNIAVFCAASPCTSLTAVPVNVSHVLSPAFLSLSIEMIDFPIFAGMLHRHYREISVEVNTRKHVYS